jgi:hypothetical protein
VPAKCIAATTNPASPDCHPNIKRGPTATDSPSMDLQTEIERNISAALSEDVGSGDLTAQLTPDRQTQAHVVCRQQAVLLVGAAQINEKYLVPNRPNRQRN